ncbi:MAG: SH3 domain-containing protein, partial [Acidobacteria bacterium]|nr:SH3 domain-containing protein [Acidobacteriota bacterium]
MRLRISLYAGAIFLALLMPLGAETVRTTSRLNLRQEPSTASARIELLPLGQELEVLSRQGSWLRVRVGDSEGWVHSDYVGGAAGAIRQPGRQADLARAVFDAELARDVALLRVRQLEEELAALRRSSAASAVEHEAGGEQGASRSQPIVVWQVPLSESLGGAAGPSPQADASDRTSAPTPAGGQTGLVEVEAPLFPSLPAARPDARVGLEAIAAVRHWAAAWSRQDVTGYLAAYALDFEPASGLDHSSWVARQQVLVSSPSFIEVTLSDLDVSVLGPDRAAVELEQS